MSERDELLIVTFLWGSRGEWRTQGTFHPNHVYGLRNMFAKHLTLPHRFVCITTPDFEDELHRLGVETYPLWPFPQVPDRQYLFDCFVRLGLWGQPGVELGKAFGSERFLQIDLDSIIAGNIDSLAEDVYEHDLKILWSYNKRGVSLNGGNGYRRGYQGALWGGRLGSHPELWKGCSDEQTVLRACRNWLGSDQAIMSELIQNPPVWTEDDGVRIRDSWDRPEPWRMLMLSGNHDGKPWGNPKWKALYFEQAGLTPPARGQFYRMGLRWHVRPAEIPEGQPIR